eukprot:TRINITY_DN28211_c0_g1_i1.p1 TRINITY_DN28211_c0_g1~~TRINITY_DN28211_c0_g1_i1.p1  ORF type:complete len:381 (-),score=82.03 TRINITY_DN28211_c0_g1_i1:73-1215(-)
MLTTAGDCNKEGLVLHEPKEGQRFDPVGRDRRNHNYWVCHTGQNGTPVVWIMSEDGEDCWLLQSAYQLSPLLEWLDRRGRNENKLYHSLLSCADEMERKRAQQEGDEEGEEEDGRAEGTEEEEYGERRLAAMEAMVIEVDKIQVAAYAAVNKRAGVRARSCLVNGTLNRGSFVSCLMELEEELQLSASSLGKRSSMWESDEIREAWSRYVMAGAEIPLVTVAETVICHAGNNLMDRAASFLMMPAPNKQPLVRPTLELSGELVWAKHGKDADWLVAEVCIVPKKEHHRPGRNGGKPPRQMVFFGGKQRQVVQVSASGCAPFTGVSCWAPPDQSKLTPAGWSSAELGRERLSRLGVCLMDRPEGLEAVSYTHLTLPTKRIV